MRRDRDRDRRDDFGGRDNDNSPPDDENASPTEMQLRALWLLDEVIRMTPRNDVRLGYLMALREQLETDEAMTRRKSAVKASFSFI